jgi:MoaA/NifB/PqqE/SkfB family radical SAM enzyme
MWLDFKITNRCNNNCVYCGVKHDNPDAKELVPIDRIVETVKSALNIGFNNFAFLGGEPTLRENCDEIFRAFDRKWDVNVLFITNGLIFDEKLVNGLFSCGAKSVSIVQSFDNFETPNYKNQNPAKILDNIKKISAIAKAYETSFIKRKVHIHSVISRENFSNIYELVNYFYEMDIDVSLGLVCPSKFDYSERPEEYNHFNFNELTIIRKQFQKLQIENKLNFANNVLLEYLDLFPFNKVNIKEICKAGREHIIINTDGEVYPCITQSYGKTMKYGNIKDIPFELIYRKMRSFVCYDDYAPACWDHYLWNKTN